MKKGEANINEVGMMWETRSRVAALETEVLGINKRLDKITDNHLVHLQAGIDDIKEDMGKMTNELREYVDARNTSYWNLFENRYVTKDQLTSKLIGLGYVKRIVFGAVGTVLLAVLGAIIGIVIIKH